MFATIFILLYVAHLLSDYPFQSDHQASCKAAKGAAGWRANTVHAGTHVLVSAVTLTVGGLALDLHLTVPAAAVALVWVGATHSIIDRRWPVIRWMEATRQREFVKHGGAAHVDQTFHITALAVAALGLAVI